MRIGNSSLSDIKSIVSTNQMKQVPINAQTDDDAETVSEKSDVNNTEDDTATNNLPNIATFSVLRRDSSYLLNPTVDITQLIKSNHLFAHATDEFIQDLEKRMKYRYLQPGDTIIREGEIGKAMFFIVRGYVVVSSKDGDSIFADLGPGQFFGELGILFEIPRTANVICKSRCLFAVLTAHDLHDMLGLYPQMADEITMEAKQRFQLLMKNGSFKKVSLNTNVVSMDSFHLKTYDFQYMSEDNDFNEMHKNVSCFKEGELVVQTTDMKSGQIYYLNSGEIKLVDDDGTQYASLKSSGIIFGTEALCNLEDNEINLKYIVNSSTAIVSTLSAKSINRLSKKDFKFKTNLETSSSRMKNFYSILKRHATPSSSQANLDRRRLSIQVPTTLNSVISPISDSPPTSDKIFVRNQSFPLSDTSKINFSNSFDQRQLQNFLAKAPMVTSGSVNSFQISSASSISINEIPDDKISNLRLAKTASLESFSLKSSNNSLDTSSRSKYTSQNLLGTRSSRGSDICEITSSEETQSSEENSENENNDTEISDLPPTKYPMLINPALKFDTQKRRASVAVWADTKLAEFASQQAQKMVQLELPSSPSRFSSVDVEDEDKSGSENNSIESVYQPAVKIILDKRGIEIALSKCDFKTIWKCRGIHPTWKTSIDNSSSLLRKVDLSPMNKVVDDQLLETILKAVGGKIEVLILKNCWKVTNSGLRNLSSYCKNVQILDLCGCWDITDDGLSALSLGCRELKGIDLSNCRKVTDKGLSSMMTNCCNLMDVYLSYCKVISDLSLEQVSMLSPNIRRINLQRCLGITDVGFSKFGTINHVKLHELILSDCSFLTDISMQFIANSCPNLKILNISFCCALTDQGISFITEGCTKLRVLDASFCGSAISDESIEWIASRLPLLERLSVRGCINMTDIGMEHLMLKSDSMKILNISNCKNISEDIKVKIPTKWKLLTAQTPIIDQSGITGMESFGSTHIRRYTAP